MITLIETREGALRSLLPGHADPAGLHAALTSAIARHLTPAHAALFAQPSRTKSGTAWLAQGAGFRRYADLPAADRQLLLSAAGAILSDIRRLIESGVAPEIAAAWPQLREIPDLGYVFAVDGRPVLAAWSQAPPAGPSGLLARFDDGVPWRPRARAHWAVYGSLMALLAGLALAAGLLTPFVRHWLAPPPAACVVPPEQLAAFADERREAARGDQLKQQLAVLVDEIGRRRLTCPIRVEPAPAPVPVPVQTPSPPQPAPPPPRAELPQEKWDKRDMTMLQGCWHLYTEMIVETVETGETQKLQSWNLCFDADGRGRQILTLQDGRRCSGPLQASFDSGGILQIQEPRRCAGTLNMLQGEMACRRLSDTEADCQHRSLEGRRRGDVVPGRFRR